MRLLAAILIITIAMPIDTLEKMATTDENAMVRAACAFALQKLGRNYTARLIDLMADEKVVPQVQDYLVELGPLIVGVAAPRLQDPDPIVRAAVADVLGVVADASSVPALEAAAKGTDPTAAQAAKRAVARLRAK